MEKKVLVETSARHVHLTEEQIEVLFGKGAKLTHKKDLSQPGQFACEERVTVVGPKRQIERVIILGPARKAGQVEVSFTDARTFARAATLQALPDASWSVPAASLTLRRALSLQSAMFTLIPQLQSSSALRTSR